MQVNAINSFSNVNFEGRRNKKAEKNSLSQTTTPTSEGFMKKLSGPLAAVMFMVPVAVAPTACTDKFEVSAHAGVDMGYPPCPPDKEVDLDWSVQDSLLTWGNDYLDIPIDGVDGNKKDKALRYAEGKRQWDFNKLENIELNLPLSNKYETRYNHKIGEDIENDIRITKVNPGEITIVKPDGTMTDNVSGLMFNEDGYKTFAHSNGKDSIYVYPKATEGEYNGKYVQKGVVGRGYLDKDQFGDNVLLVGFLSPGTPDYPPTEDHYIEVAGKAITKDEIQDILNDTTKETEE